MSLHAFSCVFPDQGLPYPMKSLHDYLELACNLVAIPCTKIGRKVLCIVCYIEEFTAKYKGISLGNWKQSCLISQFYICQSSLLIRVSFGHVIKPKRRL